MTFGPYLRAKDAARYLGVGLSFFTAYIADVVPCVDATPPGRVKRVRTWHVADLDAWAAARRTVGVA